MNEHSILLNKLVAGLRALYLVHQHSHWKTSGLAFYGDHLMFQRLYEAAAGDVDSLAERLVGLFGSNALNVSEQSAVISYMLSKFSGANHVENSSRAEQYVIESLKSAIPRLEAVSPGLDNLLRDIYDNRESSLFLLRQRRG